MFFIQLFLLFSLAHPGIDFSALSYKDLSFFSSKAAIIQHFGEPEIHFPRYECGFHSDVEQSEGPYYQLIYPNITFIGSDKEGFIFERIHFDPLGENTLKYKEFSFSGKATVEEFGQAFPKEEGVQKFVSMYPESSYVSLANYSPEYQVYMDDRAGFYFAKGLLVKYEYFSPC